MSTTIPYNNMETPRTRYVLVRCCYIFPPRIGCILLGYMSVILNIINIFAVIIIKLLGSYFHVKKPKGTVEDLPMGTEITSVMLCFSFVWLILNIAVLVGIHKNRPGPVIVYFILGMARSILGFIAFFYLMMNHFITNDTLIISYCIDLGVTAWFLMIYYHYGLQLKREQATSSDIEQVVYNNGVTSPT